MRSGQGAGPQPHPLSCGEAARPEQSGTAACRSLNRDPLGPPRIKQDEARAWPLSPPLHTQSHPQTLCRTSLAHSRLASGMPPICPPPGVDSLLPGSWESPRVTGRGAILALYGVWGSQAGGCPEGSSGSGSHGDTRPSGLQPPRQPLVTPAGGAWTDGLGAA